MNTPSLKYKTKTATKEEIYSHLKKCNDNFNPPLDKRVNIREYSKKIFEKSVSFEAWIGNILVGLAAAYFNDLENHPGYITNISLIKDYSGMGIASELMKQCLEYAKHSQFKEIRLEVHEENIPAIRLYKKFGFKDFENKKNFIIMRLKI